MNRLNRLNRFGGRFVRSLVAGAMLGSGLAQSAQAQSAPPPSPIGVWRGTSSCLVRPSACNDEVVVYRIIRTNAADSLAVDARKIVSGEEQEMGVLGCRLTAATGQLTCTIPRGTWRLTVRNDSLTGELRLPDNTRFREVRAKRAP